MWPRTRRDGQTRRVLEAARLKMRRAHALLQGLARDLDDGAQVRSELVYEPQSDGRVLVRFMVTATPPSQWRSVVGDVLQNLRSSLDAAVWELVVAADEPLPEKVAMGVHFPVSKSRKDFESGSTRWHAARLDEERQTIVELLQPWWGAEQAGADEGQRSVGVARDPLMRLHDLARKDRHRSPHLGLVAPNLVYAEMPNGAEVENFGHGPWRNGDVIATVRAAPDGRLPVVRHLPRLILDEDISPLGGEPVVDRLHGFEMRVRFALGALEDGRVAAMPHAFLYD